MVLVTEVGELLVWRQAFEKINSEPLIHNQTVSSVLEVREPPLTGWCTASSQQPPAYGDSAITFHKFQKYFGSWAYFHKNKVVGDQLQHGNLIAKLEQSSLSSVKFS